VCDDMLAFERLMSFFSTVTIPSMTPLIDERRSRSTLRHSR